MRERSCGDRRSRKANSIEHAFLEAERNLSVLDLFNFVSRTGMSGNHMPKKERDVHDEAAGQV